MLYSIRGFSLIIGFLVILLFVKYESNAEKEIPKTKIGNGITAPTLKFLYCYSCGYKKMFDEYQNIIHERYPTITVDGWNYDPPGMNMWLAKFIGLLKIVVMILISTGYFGNAQISWWTWCLENKIYSCMMIYFVSNIIEGHLISSGAFEIFLNDVPVWSKLETGRIPQPAELFNIIDSHMQFDTKVELKPGFAK